MNNYYGRMVANKTRNVDTIWNQIIKKPKDPNEFRYKYNQISFTLYTSEVYLKYINMILLTHCKMVTISGKLMYLSSHIVILARVHTNLLS